MRRGWSRTATRSIALGLARAHDLDDVPARDALYAVARRVDMWRVDPHRVIAWEPSDPTASTRRA